MFTIKSISSPEVLPQRPRVAGGSRFESTSVRTRRARARSFSWLTRAKHTRGVQGSLSPGGRVVGVRLCFFLWFARRSIVECNRSRGLFVVVSSGLLHGRLRTCALTAVWCTVRLSPVCHVVPKYQQLQVWCCCGKLNSRGKEQKMQTCILLGTRNVYIFVDGPRDVSFTANSFYFDRACTGLKGYNIEV